MALSNPAVNPCDMDWSVIFVNVPQEDVTELKDHFCQKNLTALFMQIRQDIDLTYLLPYTVYQPPLSQPIRL